MSNILQRIASSSVPTVASSMTITVMASPALALVLVRISLGDRPSASPFASGAPNPVAESRRERHLSEMR